MLLKISIPNKMQLRVTPDFKSTVFGDRGGGIQYIGGAEILPPPLNRDEEADVLSKLGTVQDSNARSVLIERNLRLVVYIAKKYVNTSIGIEDLISIGTIGLIKAVNTFDVCRKITLATYASRCIENEILMYLRRNKKTSFEVSIDEPLNVDWDGNELLLSDLLGTDGDEVSKVVEEKVDRTLLRQALSTLTERERSIINLRFGLDDELGVERTQQEVANLIGVSQSYLSRWEKVIIKKLKTEILQFN